MTKKGQEKSGREVTKRQLSRWQQQKRRQRLLFSIGIFVIVAALAVVGVGWYITEYQPGHEVVIEVNDTSFNMNYYVKILEYYGAGQSSDYLELMVGELVTVIEQNELIRQEAEKLGIEVSDAEVDEEYKDSDPPLKKDYRDLGRTEMLVERLMDEHFEHEVPLSDEQVQLLAMFLESESQVTQVKARLEAGEDFTELAGDLSLESNSREQNGDLGWQQKDILAGLLLTSVPGDYAFSAEVGVLSPPLYDEGITKEVGYWLAKVLERDAESGEVHIQGILLGSEEEVYRIRERLEAGDDFDTLAGELSQDTQSKMNGGDLGWLSPDPTGAVLEGFALDEEVEIGTVSEPIRDESVMTTGGYWLLKVVDREDDRQIEDEDREVLKYTAFEEWLTSLWDNPENHIESYLDAEKQAWAISKVAGS